jgi:hypothetical protein
MANRKERRRARKTSPVRHFKVAFELEGDITMHPAATQAMVHQFCEAYPEIEAGKTAVMMVNTDCGVFKIDALERTNTIRISGPYSEGAVDVFNDMMVRYGGVETVSPPSQRPNPRCEIDLMIKAAWDRNDATMLSEEAVKALLAQLVEQYSHWTDRTIIVTSHRVPTSPPGQKRLLLTYVPGENRITIAVLKTPEQEAKADAFMNGPVGEKQPSFLLDHRKADCISLTLPH